MLTCLSVVLKVKKSQLNAVLTPLFTTGHSLFYSLEQVLNDSLHRLMPITFHLYIDAGCPSLLSPARNELGDRLLVRQKCKPLHYGATQLQNSH